MKLEKRNQIGLMGSGLVYNILYVFLNTFMVAYFITLTNYDYGKISIFYLVEYIFIIITFVLLGKVVKNYSQVGIHRIGIALHSLYIVTLAILKTKIIKYYIFLGMFYGISLGFFWLSTHTMLNEYASKNSKKYLYIKGVLDNVFKILFPLVFGVSIDLTSFSYIAKIILVLSIIQFGFSFLIKDDDMITSKKYDLKLFFKKHCKNPLLVQYYQMYYCDSIINSLLHIVITILIVITFKTNISLGILTTLFSIGTIISLFVYQKIKNKHVMLNIATIGLVLSIYILLFNISKTTIIIYNLCSGLFLLLLKNEANAKRYDLLNKIKDVQKNFIVEHQVVTEISLNISRLVGFTILFIASLASSMFVFKVLLFSITLIILLYSRLIINLDK